MTKCLLLLVASSGIAFAGCIPVTGNRILGRDLAVADARFSALPASLTIGFTPAPGARRIFAALELQRLARANGISVGNPKEICFELPMLRLKEEDADAAMRHALPAQAALKIVELANFDVPVGLLEFPLEGLEPPVASDHGVQLWRGSVKYAETRRMAVWARVEVTVRSTVVIAHKDLPANIPISAASLRIEDRTGPLEREKAATRIEDVQGRMPKRSLQAGSVIPLAVLADAPTVRRGDPVAVEVWSGPARLRFQAIAESSARDGEIIELHNPFNGKTFKVRLDSGAKALVVITAGQKL
jgi:flagella basal body P-ring formation protein FlgA